MHVNRHAITVGVQQVSVIESGTGPRVIIFLHGWGGEAESFIPLWEQLEPLASRSRFVAPDLPGFGQSPEPAVPWGVREYVECVIGIMDQLGVERAVLVSHSFGGRLATVLLTAHPKRFLQCVYIAAAGIRHSHESKRDSLSFIARLLKPLFMIRGLRRFFPLVRRLGYRLVGSRDYVEASGVMKESFKKVIEEDLSPLLHLITVPVFIFWGRNDTYVPVADAQYMQQQIKGSELLIFDDGRHGIHKTHATQIGQHVVPFLSSSS